MYELTPRTDSSPLAVTRASAHDPLASIVTSKRVTLASNNADARTLLLWLAKEAELSIVISQDVQARVTVNFQDAPVLTAMRAVMAEARLSFLVGASATRWPPVVFYELPVNVDQAGVEALVARFGISPELARWIAENRERP